MSKDKRADQQAPKKHMSHKEVVAKHELEQHEDTQVLNFLKKYGRLIVYATVAAAIVSVGYNYISHSRATNRQAAEQLLFRARDTAELQRIINEYGSSPVAPIATLAKAQKIFNAGNYGVAREEYESFLKNYPENEFVPVALLGKALSLEVTGKNELALSEFTSLAGEHQEHSVYPQAVLGRVRCLDRKGDSKEALAACNAFLERNPDNVWSGQILQKMDALKEN